MRGDTRENGAVTYLGVPGLLLGLGGFFMLVNASMLVAWGYHLSGRRAVVWEPTRR